MEPVYPDTFILPTADLLQEYLGCLESYAGFFDEPHNRMELMAQAFVVLVNNQERTFLETSEDLFFNVGLVPDFNRMVNSETLNPHARGLIMHYTVGLILAIRDRIRELRGFTDKGFPYFLRQLLADDAVLSHLPY